MLHRHAMICCCGCPDGNEGEWNPTSWSDGWTDGLQVMPCTHSEPSRGSTAVLPPKPEYKARPKPPSSPRWSVDLLVSYVLSTIPKVDTSVFFHNDTDSGFFQELSAGRGSRYNPTPEITFTQERPATALHSYRARVTNLTSDRPLQLLSDKLVVKELQIHSGCKHRPLQLHRCESLLSESVGPV